MMLTVPIHSLNLKESNTYGHKFEVKQNDQEPSLDKTFLVYK